MRPYLRHVKLAILALGVFCVGLMVMALIQSNTPVFVILGALFIAVVGARVGVSLYESHCEAMDKERRRRQGMEAAMQKLSESTGTFYVEDD